MSSYPKEFANHYIGVGGVIIHDNKILLVQPNYGKSRGTYMIPGGFVNPGETLLEAVKREIQEETGAEVEAERVISIRTMVRESDQLTDLYCIIKCKLTSDPKLIRPQESEIEIVNWIPVESSFNNPSLSEYTKLIIRNTIKTNNGLIQGKQISDDRKTKFGIKKYEEFWTNH